MQSKPNIYGIGLFGSWTRGDAVTSSDVDLFILDKAGFDHEYVERVGVCGLFIDLNHVPKRWLHEAIPPEIDHKLRELHILYDRDWSLTNTKLLMDRAYTSPDRVNIRTDAHIVESDIYLSRATSAFSRQDFKSAHLFAVLATERVLKILAETAFEPLPNSHFLDKLEVSATKLHLHNMFKEYLEIAGLNKVTASTAVNKLKAFKVIWEELAFTAKQPSQRLDNAHFTVRTKLRYYLDLAFLQGVLMRAGTLAESGRSAETSHYLDSILVDILENYLYLKSSTGNAKMDCTTLIRSLEGFDQKSSLSVTDFLGLGDVNKSEASETIGKSREMVLTVRRDRKALIKNSLLKN